MDATARLAGHAVIEIGTHVEILGEQGWWPATITWREVGSGGRLVKRVLRPFGQLAEFDTAVTRCNRGSLYDEANRRESSNRGRSAAGHL